MEKEKKEGQAGLISGLPVSNLFPSDGNVPSLLPPPPPEIEEEKGRPYSSKGWRVLKHHKRNKKNHKS